MINNKLQVFLTVLVWYMALIGFRLAVPINPVGTEVLAKYFLLASLLMWLLVSIYVKYRNKSVVKKIMDLKKKDEMTVCLQYLDKLIKAQPNIYWLKFERLIVLAEAGKGLEYHAYKELLLSDKKCVKGLKTLNKNLMNKFDCLFEYFKGEKEFASGVNVVSPKSYIDYSYNLLLEIKNKGLCNEVISKALYIYNSNIKLYKVFASVVLAECYRNMHDEANAIIYEKAAVEYASENELLTLVELKISM